MQIVFYISGHGLGHASRDIELIHALRALRPDARILVRSAAPQWLFEASADPAVNVQAVDTDTGLVQLDSLRFDEEETARLAARFYAEFDARVAEEADVLRASRAVLVLGDIPPLAFAAAARAGIPSVAIANFTWDWIYSIYSTFDLLAPDVIPLMRRAYADATLALRLPLHGGFETMAGVTCDIPFIARRSTRAPDQTRRLLGLNGDRPIVLASFGGHGLSLPYDQLTRPGRFTLVITDREAGAAAAQPSASLCRIAPETLRARGLRYEDLVAAADVVVSKPGYGIVSECVANQTALLYTSRGRFVEYDVFVAGMPDVLRCRFLEQEEMVAGRWADAVEALLAQPAPPARPRVDGAEVAAALIAPIIGA